MSLSYTDGSEGIGGRKILIIAPVLLKQKATDRAANKEVLALYLGLVPTEEPVSIGAFRAGDWLGFLALVVIWFGSISLTALCVFRTSHSVINPLRKLNSRMREILEAEELNETNLQMDLQSCQEIN